MLVCSQFTKPLQKRTFLPFTRNLETEKLCGKGFLNLLPWLLPELWILFLLPPNVVSCPLEKSVLLYTPLFYSTLVKANFCLFFCLFFFGGGLLVVLFLLLEIKALAPDLKVFSPNKLPTCPKLSPIVRLKKIPMNLQLLQVGEISVFLHICNCQRQTILPLHVWEQMTGVRSWSV